MAAVANQFIIRDIDPSSPDFLFSSNIFDVAIRNGFYNVQRDGPKLDFLKTYAPKRAHSPYVTRYLHVVISINTQCLRSTCFYLPRNIGCENFRIWAFSSFDCAKKTRFICLFGDGYSRRENQQYGRPHVRSVKSLSHTLSKTIARRLTIVLDTTTNTILSHSMHLLTFSLTHIEWLTCKQSFSHQFQLHPPSPTISLCLLILHFITLLNLKSPAQYWLWKLSYMSFFLVRLREENSLYLSFRRWIE